VSSVKNVDEFWDFDYEARLETKQQKREIHKSGLSKFNSTIRLSPKWMTYDTLLGRFFFVS
jgi:hypothetical protein